MHAVNALMLSAGRQDGHVVDCKKYHQTISHRFTFGDRPNLHRCRKMGWFNKQDIADKVSLVNGAFFLGTYFK